MEWRVDLSLLLFLLLLGSARQSHSQSDLQCLSEFRQSVTDRTGYLDSWVASSSGNASSICSAVGVQCLHPSEAKIYSLSLRGAGLSGTFPRGLAKCSSLTGLDLSGNDFSGFIPADLCAELPFLVRLDLSNNRFTGSIPGELGQCQYLNALDLQRNRLTGGVPGQLGVLPRLTELNLVGNRLSGEIPSNLADRASFQFQDNDLCGPPLAESCGRGGTASAGIIAGTVVGGAVILLAITAAVLAVSRRRRAAGAMRDDTTWAKRIKAPRGVTVSMFEQFLVKIRLSDLMAATDGFARESVIDAGPTGVAYKATLRDGSVLAIKRLAVQRSTVGGESDLPRGKDGKSELTRGADDAGFKSEVEALGRVRHGNLVPLLGYCLAGRERLLVYKHMSNGSLWRWLHDMPRGTERLDWAARLRVALGAARGLAFLHHGCEPRILHRGVSSHTILLDDDMEARISDVGVARLVARGDRHGLGVDVEVGDPALAPPEYARVPIATAKGDVYSYGIVVLELVTSQKPLEVTVGEFRGGLAEWMAALHAAGRAADAIDKSLLSGGGVDEEICAVLKIACGCVLLAPQDRPSMYQVFQQLRKLAESYDFADPDDDIPLAAASDDAQRQRSNGTIA